MKSFLGPVFVCLGFSCAQAGLPIYEPFNYTVGSDLAGQSPNGTEFWAATGTGGTGGTDIIGVASGSLTAPGLTSLGNSIAFGGLGLTDRVALGAVINSGTVYYSFLMRVTDLGTLNTTGGFIAGFNNLTGTQAGQPTAVGARPLTRLSGGGYNIGLEKNSGTAINFIFDNTIRNVGETVFIVGSYTFNSGGSTDDSTFLWINPDPLTFGLALAPPPTLVGNLAGNDLPQIASFLFRQGNATAVPGNVITDELRVDTTWAGVTVPEPSALAMLSLIGGGFLLRRRRTTHAR